MIPGHGPIARYADLSDYVAMLTTTRDRIAKLIDGGATLEQVIAAKPTADYDAQIGDPANYVNRAFYEPDAQPQTVGSIAGGDGRRGSDPAVERALRASIAPSEASRDRELATPTDSLRASARSVVSPFCQIRPIPSASPLRRPKYHRSFRRQPRRRGLDVELMAPHADGVFLEWVDVELRVQRSCIRRAGSHRPRIRRPAPGHQAPRQQTHPQHRDTHSVLPPTRAGFHIVHGESQGTLRSRWSYEDEAWRLMRHRSALMCNRFPGGMSFVGLTRQARGCSALTRRSCVRHCTVSACEPSDRASSRPSAAAEPLPRAALPARPGRRGVQRALCSASCRNISTLAGT